MKPIVKIGLPRALGFCLLAVLLVTLATSAGATQAEKGAAASAGTTANSQNSPDNSAFIAQVAAAQHLSSDKLQVIDQVDTNLPLTGVSFHEAKVIDKSTGQEYSAAIDGNGKKVDANAARQAEQTAHTQRYGKLQPALVDKLATAGKNAVPVAIWVHPPDLSDLRKDSDPNAAVYKMSPAASDAAYQQYIATVQARIASATGPVVAVLQGAGYQAMAAGNAPLIAAELPASAINVIAQRPDVVAVFDATPPATDANKDAVGALNSNLLSGGTQSMSPDYYGGPRDLGRTVERVPQVEQAYGLTGLFSKVAIVNRGGLSFANPYLNNTTHNITQMIPNGDTGATSFAGIIASTDGLARGRAWDINRLMPPTS